jgi:hypothetical protein
VCLINALKQGHQAACTVKRRKVIITAYVGVADEDLWHCSAVCAGHHGISLRWVSVDADFFNVSYAALAQQGFGACAIGAKSSAVHHNFIHSIVSRKRSVIFSWWKWAGQRQAKR